ncbi:MAG: DoxX family membrane protein [Burkholderiales bacterium]
MDLLDGTWLDTAGRLLFVGYFLIAGLCNLAAHQVRSHIDRMRDLGTPLPAFAFWTGLAIQFAGCALLLTERFAAAGALCLLFFTVAATVIFHRFWQFADPQRRNASRINFLNNSGVVAGLLLLLQNVR